jgi:hypothetical protein
LRAIGGRTHYGQAIGILTLETHFPRFPGDMGNASTFNFPVKLKAVNGASITRVVKQGDPALLQPFIDAAKELEHDGVRAVTTTCGFLVLFQDEIAKALKIPVYTSSLLQIPLVHKMLGEGQRVGVLTADSSSLSERHLAKAGISSIPLAIYGMQRHEEFARAYLRDETDIDFGKIQGEVLNAAELLMAKYHDLGAFVFECANMPGYSEAVRVATGLPVFDIFTLTNYVYYGVLGGSIHGFM